MMIARTSDRVVALVIDEVHGVIEHEPSAVVASSHVAHGLDALPGVVRLEDGLVFIHDLDRFLSTDEARVLETAMSQGLSC
jgi:purine-binding chemotaxis protein CheW